MKEFLLLNSSAIFALVGAIFGASVTGILTYASKIKETKLRMVEKLLDKKLEAHEELINIIGFIRTMIMLGGDDKNGDLKRCPLILSGENHISEFLEQFVVLENRYDRWFSASVKREISFFKDYYINARKVVEGSSDEAMREVGVIIKYDFIAISLRLEDTAHDFFNKDMLKLKYGTDRNWHKFSQEETLKKLKDTDLCKKDNEIIEILRGPI